MNNDRRLIEDYLPTQATGTWASREDPVRQNADVRVKSQRYVEFVPIHNPAERENVTDTQLIRGSIGAN